MDNFSRRIRTIGWHGTITVFVVLVASTLSTRLARAYNEIPVAANAPDGVSFDQICSFREAVWTANGQAQSADCAFAALNETNTLTLSGPVQLTSSAVIEITSSMVVQSAMGDRVPIQGGPSEIHVNPDVGAEMYSVTLSGFHKTPIIVDGGLSLHDVEIVGNDNTEGTQGRAGAIHVTPSGYLYMVYSSVRNNLGTNGALMNDGTTDINASSITGNRTGEFGGGIYVGGGLVTLLNTTISDNVDAGVGGGGIYVAAGTVHVRFSTITANVSRANGASGSEFQGGEIRVAGGTLTVSASIIAHNNSSGCTGSITSEDYNIFDECNVTLQPSDIAGSPGLDGVLSGSDQDGGWYHLLLPTSPAIDWVLPDVCSGAQFDERLSTQRADGSWCDVGAVEH